MPSPTQRILSSVGIAVAAAASFPGASVAGDDPYAQLPQAIELTGVVRDFKERGTPGGHPDFELNPTGGFGQYGQIVQDKLDEEGKPAFRSTGFKLTNQFRDTQGRNITNPRSYINPMPGDVNGRLDTKATGAVTGEESFRQWFRDVPGVNLSKTLPLTLRRQPGTNMYTFDDQSDPSYRTRSGFFPINGELLGNSGGSGAPDTNYHFTFELETEFMYEAGKGQSFRFVGDDDVWVYIDGRLVIDVGGIHAAVSQVVDLDRLNWLKDGESYRLKFFFAERHRTQSNFRIETTLWLLGVDPPVMPGLAD